jgi:hypothetical protein
MTRAARCYDCHKPYGDADWIEAIVPDRVWNRIRPEGCDEGCGLLCVGCISRRLRALLPDGSKVPVWLCGTEALRPMIGDPGDRLDVLREWDIDQGFPR